ncbi:MAG: hypothetical protein ACI4EX_03000 [Lachnospiraceae bacterium]
MIAVLIMIVICFCYVGCGETSENAWVDNQIEAAVLQQVQEQNKIKDTEADIESAQEIATAVNVAFADGWYEEGTLEVTCMPNGNAFPNSKTEPSNSWRVYLYDCGVEKITLGGFEIYPDPAQYKSIYE